jgi:hypothetical protein
LYTNPGNFRAFKILIAAVYNGVDVEVVDVDLSKPPKEFKAASPSGKVPVLVTDKGESDRIHHTTTSVRTRHPAKIGPSVGSPPALRGAGGVCGS